MSAAIALITSFGRRGADQATGKRVERELHHRPAHSSLPDAMDCHFLEHGFDLSGLDFIANPELPFPTTSLDQCYTKFNATMLHRFLDGSPGSVNSYLLGWRKAHDLSGRGDVRNPLPTGWMDSLQQLVSDAFVLHEEITSDEFPSCSRGPKLKNLAGKFAGKNGRRSKVGRASSQKAAPRSRAPRQLLFRHSSQIAKSDSAAQRLLASIITSMQNARYLRCRPLAFASVGCLPR